jgi:aspartyl/asparaginyl-tRNA synthetase
LELQVISSFINRDKIYVATIGQYAGKEVTLYGWLYNARHSGKLWFLLLRDGTGIIHYSLEGRRRGSLCALRAVDAGTPFTVTARCEDKRARDYG